LGADLIVGFPGETEEDFLRTLEGVKRWGLAKVHAFPFSPHRFGEKVAASYLKPQVPQEIKKQRERQLLEVAKLLRQKFI